VDADEAGRPEVGLRINGYEVDLVAPLVASLPPEPPGEQAADHNDGEAYRSLPY
jgi:hypothetical protein